jgi:hypothetical protein
MPAVYPYIREPGEGQRRTHHMLSIAFLAAAPALAPGTYGLSMTFVTEADAPIVGKVTTSTLTTAVVRVRQEDGKLIATQHACRVSTDGGLFIAEAGPAFLAALADVTYEIEVDGDRLRADLGIAALGVDPKVKSLPKRRDDPAFLDPDRDGKKGVPLEVHVGGMQLHLDVASLGHAVLVGVLDGDGARGKPRVLMSEERILGGLPEMLAGGTKRVVESKSSFTLEPLRDGATCDALRRVRVAVRM